MADLFTLAKKLNIAKLVQPDVSGLLPRERLFQQVDKANDGFAWVMGPAGAGKTTLLSSWVQSRQKNTLWYRVDIGDSDPATFFHYFSLALGDYAIGLPAFSFEHIPNLEIFARRFFRACFESIPSNTVIIFDNCHAVHAEDILFLIINWLLEERVPGCTIICSSRQTVPSRLNSWQIAPNYSYIGWGALCSTLEEANAIAEILGYSCLPKQIYQNTGGWLAGLVLQLRVNKGDALSPAQSQDADEMAVLFSIFAEGAFNGLKPEQQKVLIHTAFAPRLTAALAIEITKDSFAGEQLFQLHREHFFLERSMLPDGTVSYSFHPLLKAFLKDRAKRTIPEAELIVQYTAIANWLESQNEFEDALELWVLSSNWEAVVNLIQRQAPVLLYQGQIATFFRWITLIPFEIADKEPAIHYWKGMVLTMSSPPLARMSLQAAYEGYKAKNNKVEALLAVCAALESYFFEWGNWKDAIQWVNLIETLVEEIGEFPSLEVEIRVISASFAMLFPCSNHPLIVKWAKRAETLIATLDAPEPRIALSLFLITYHFLCGEPRIARALAEEMVPLAEKHSRSPIFGIALTIWCGTCHWRDGDNELAINSLNRTLELANMSGVHQMDYYVHCHKMVSAQSASDLAAAEAAHKLMVATMPTGMGAKQFFSLAISGLYLMRGDLEAGLHSSQDAVGYFNETGWELGATLSRNVVALFLILTKEINRARIEIKKVLDYSVQYSCYWLQFQAELMLAACEFKDGFKSKGIEILKHAFLLGQEKGIRNFHPWWVPELMSELFAHAIDANIETVYASDIIMRRKIPAPPNPSANWPWPLKIKTLGGFLIIKNGAPLKFERKAQKRVLELIKAIAALGGKGVSLDRLSTLLWEDSEGDKANNYCHVALHRARNLLEIDQALIVSDGKVSFNPAYVCFDSWEFNKLASELEKQVPETDLDSTVAKLMEIYPGAFLEGDSGKQWVLEQRERLLNRYQRSVALTGEQCEKLNQDALAIKLYCSALDQPTPPETLCFRLMQCHQRMGHYAEALATFDRFERQMATASKRAPSAKIKTLRDQIENLARI